jgi:hypothetical protein
MVRRWRVDTTATRSEAEALILENNLIKSLAPKYNILFRDDKSYPYIELTADEFPRRLPPRHLRPRARATSAPFPTVGGAREHPAAAEDLPAAHLREQRVRQPLAPLPAAPDPRCKAPCVGLVSRPTTRPTCGWPACSCERPAQRGHRRPVAAACRRRRRGLALRGGGACARPDPRAAGGAAQAVRRQRADEDVDIVAAVVERGSPASIWPWCAAAAPGRPGAFPAGGRRRAARRQAARLPRPALCRAAPPAAGDPGQSGRRTPTSSRWPGQCRCRRATRWSAPGWRWR